VRYGGGSLVVQGGLFTQRGPLELLGNQVHRVVRGGLSLLRNFIKMPGYSAEKTNSADAAFGR